MESADEYDVCNSGKELFWKEERSKSTWKEFAKELEKRLAKSKPSKKGYYSGRRDELSNWLIIALKGAEREK